MNSLSCMLMLCIGCLAEAVHLFGPVLAGAFPDPTIILVNDTYFAFSSRNTVGDTTMNIPIATSKSLTSGWGLVEKDALPHAGIWTASKPHVLTPDVNRLEDGTFIIYYIAIPKGSDQKRHCVGAATAKTVTGPYQPQSTPVLCLKSNQQGSGTADPNGFVYKGSRYIVFKNASGHDAQHESHIAIEKVQQNGYSPVSMWTDLIKSTTADDNDVEGSCLVANPSKGGGFVLFFTTGTFNTTNLKIEYATASELLGPYKRRGVLLESGVYSKQNISAPVGLDVVNSNVSQAVFEAFGSSGERPRRMYAVELKYNGTDVSAV